MKLTRKPSQGKWPRRSISMTEDRPNQKKMRIEVKNAKVKQVEKVNRLRRMKAAKYSRKDPIAVGDICTVSTQGLKKVSFPHLPVLITGTSMKGDVTKYTVASKFGYLRGTFVRRDLSHRKNYTVPILNLDPEVDGLKENLSLQDACNELALGVTGNCSGDCSSISCCSCKAAGTFCTSLCHSGRGKNKKCTLLNDLCCSGSDNSESEEE